MSWPWSCRFLWGNHKILILKGPVLLDDGLFFPHSTPNSQVQTRACFCDAQVTFRTNFHHTCQGASSQGWVRCHWCLWGDILHLHKLQVKGLTTPSAVEAHRRCCTGQQHGVKSHQWDGWSHLSSASRLYMNKKGGTGDWGDNWEQRCCKLPQQLHSSCSQFLGSQAPHSIAQLISPFSFWKRPFHCITRLHDVVYLCSLNPLPLFLPNSRSAY